jgi:hypothetical protein
VADYCLQQLRHSQSPSLCTSCHYWLLWHPSSYVTASGVRSCCCCCCSVSAA